MLSTISRTWEITKISWGVLKQDRKLLLFPIISVLALVALAGALLGVAGGLGTLGRLEAGAGVTAADVALLAVTYFALAFIVIYFNAALIGAAMVRLAGGDVTLGDGFRLANQRLPQILGWSLMSATVGLILQALRSQARDSFLGQLVVSMVGGVWAYLTFFVVPVLVAEGVGPATAIRRSGALFKRTWGEQVTANFGFSLVGLGLVLVAAIPAVLVGAVYAPAGVAVGVVTVGLALAAVSCLEAIFKTALYGYVADGKVAEGFTRADLEGAYGRNAR